MIFFMLEDLLKQRREIEGRKAAYHRQIDFHTKNVILQSVVSFLFIVAAIFYARKQDPLAPFVMVPSATLSLKKLESSETKRRHYKKMLENLERNYK